MKEEGKEKTFKFNPVNAWFESEFLTNDHDRQNDESKYLAEDLKPNLNYINPKTLFLKHLYSANNNNVGSLNCGTHKRKKNVFIVTAWILLKCPVVKIGYSKLFLETNLTGLLTYSQVNVQNLKVG